MTITLTILGFIAVWGIGYAIGRTTATEPLPLEYLQYLNTKPRDWRDIEKLEIENRSQRREIIDLQSRLAYGELLRRCRHEVYSCTQDEQKLTDLLQVSATAAQKIHDDILKEITK